MHTYPKIDVFLYHNMKLYKMIEIYLKYDNMHTFGVISDFICINNHVNSCINSMLSYWKTHQKRKFSYDIRYYFWEEPKLFHLGADQIIRRCVPEEEQEHILSMCHSSLCGGHFASRKTGAKEPQSGFYWPTLFKDAIKYCMECLKCQSALNISKRDEMPLKTILDVEIFDLWGIDFMGPFPSSEGKEYILVAVDYVSKLGRGNTDKDKRSSSG